MLLILAIKDGKFQPDRHPARGIGECFTPDETTVDTYFIFRQIDIRAQFQRAGSANRLRPYSPPALLRAPRKYSSGSAYTSTTSLSCTVVGSKTSLARRTAGNNNKRRR